MLAVPNFSLPLKVEVDASTTGGDAVLLQDGDQGVCYFFYFYFSVKFRKHQLNYLTIEQETLAILLAS